VAALRRAGVEASDTSLTRSMYASDASLHRVPPLAVAAPRDRDAAEAALSVCRELAVPVTWRGAGTSIAGNAIGPGLVLLTKHLNRIDDLDLEAGTATVGPGVVHATLQRRVLPLGWRFGPDPSTHDRATIGGMIGNNACGSRALGYGRTSDNVLGLDVVTGSGERLVLGSGLGDPGGLGGAATIAGLASLVGRDLGTVRREFGRFGRQVSGYSLEHLLPEKGVDAARFLVGSEGTLASTLRARVRLVRESPVRVLVALGYPSMAQAADAVPALLAHRPVACEGLDSRITETVRARCGLQAVPPLPRGAGWLLVELAGEDLGEVHARAGALVAEAGALDAQVVTDPVAAQALWRIREDGAGLSSRAPSGRPAHSGWEDAAVPPAALGAYLREFDALLTEHALTGIPYGHFGDGCLHIRIDFPLAKTGGTAAYRSFLLDAAALAATHGGSVSGEHGDGRARSELLATMYSPRALDLFARVKGLLDPQRALNPGIIVDPAPLDADVRLAATHPVTVRELPTLRLGLHDDDGDLSQAVHRCTGVGKCLADNGSRGGVMCPSYLATGEEKDSPRARARVLQDALAGHLGPEALASDEVAEVLDLCLACKGCASDCPTGTDIAAYKAQALAERYRGRRRPRSHYVLGWLPEWSRWAGRMPGAPAIVNAGLAWGPVRRLATRVAGVDRAAQLPTLARRTFRRWFADHAVPQGDRPEVVLFTDTFTQGFSPEVGEAAVAVLEAAGYRVLVTQRQVCCGLTWMSTGQLEEASRRAGESVVALIDHVRAGRLIVGLEPSCTAALRSDAIELAPTPEAAATAREVAAATRTLAELLAQTPGWEPPDLTGVIATAQPHCHQHAVMGFDADAALLTGAGARVDVLGGCCGLAGNFGVEDGHREISVAVAGQQLLPGLARLDAATEDGVVLADGFSCRTQIAALSAHEGRHFAELLAERLSQR
jgi:FAD/FMN-containing dehydrogenase/Fe-S oxidoreductase